MSYIQFTGEVDDTKRHIIDMGQGLEGYLIMDRQMCIFKYPHENREDDIHMRVAVENLTRKITEILEVWAYEDSLDDEDDT